MKGFLYLVVILLVGSCKTPATNHNASGKLRYTSFTWHYDKAKDSFVLYVANYLNIDGNGKFVSMKHNTFMDSARYFSGTISDTLREEIDTLLANDSYSKNYLFSPDTAAIYDGFTYGFDYQKGDSVRKFILFIPELSPPKIHQLYTDLEGIISTGNAKSIDSFSIESFKAELQNKAIAAGIKIPKSVPPMVELRKNK